MTRYHILGNKFDRDYRNKLNENFDNISNDLNGVVKKISDDVLNKLIDSAKLNWLSPPVDNFEEISIVHPSPNEGDAVMVRDGGIYRWNGESWLEIQNIDPTAYNNLENRLDEQVQSVKDIIESNDKQYKLEFENLSEEIDAVKEKNERTKFLDLTEPIYICHRGAANIYPENTLESFKGCLSQNNIIEMDVQTLRDGNLGVMHDFTVDRTTTKTGRVEEFSAMGFRNLSVDILPGYKNVFAPLFEDVISAFGKAAIYIPESKDKKSVRKIVDTLERYDLKEYSLVQSSDINDLQYAVAKGYQTLLLTNNADPDIIVDNGIRYVGVSQGISDGYIQSCISKGIKVIVYTINNRFLKNQFLSKGVSGFFTDDPFYLEDIIHPIYKDPFSNQVFYHGMIKSLTFRGEFSEGNRWGFNQTSDSSKPNDGRDFVLQGWANQLNEEFKITFDFKYTEHINSGWLSVVLCTPNDFFDDHGPLSSGYNILLGKNGMITLYRVDSGVATKLLEINTPEVPINTQIPIEIEMKMSGIKITRKDTGESNQFNDANYRNGYLHFGRKYSNGTFGNVVIS